MRLDCASWTETSLYLSTTSKPCVVDDPVRSEILLMAAVCGPPLLDIFGGRGRGAEGNLIVSRIGEVLGADMKSFGKFYDDAAEA